MKLHFLKYSAFFAVIACMFQNTASARIGETKSDIETRMLPKNGGAYVYTSKEDRLREAFELPYTNLFLMMPKTAHHVFLFKRSDTQGATNSDTLAQHDLYGWEMHLCLDDGLSALEFYRKHGNPMTLEELEELMNLMLKSAPEGTYWKKNTFVPVLKNWNVSLKDGVLTAESPNAKSKNVADILPMGPRKFVYVEVPSDVKMASTYPTSIQFQLMEDAQRKANDNYSNYVSKQASIRANKTSKKGAKGSGARTINNFDAYSQRQFESDFPLAADSSKTSRFVYRLDDILYNEAPLSEIVKDVRIVQFLPLQPDTAFEYTYELSDGSIRAKLYRNGVLFVSSKFDKDLRKYMDGLYTDQQKKRKLEAEDSVSKF